MSLPRKIALVICVMFASFLYGQSPPLDGEYIYKPEKGEGKWTLKLQADSTYTWNFSESKNSSSGHWKIGKEEITLREDGTQKEIHFKVISGDDSERAVLYYKKSFYFKKT